MVRQRTRSRYPRAPIAACRCVLICTPVHYIQRELRFDLYNGKLVAGQIRLLSAIRGYDDKAGNVSAGYPAHSHLSLPAPPTHPLPRALNPPPLPAVPSPTLAPRPAPASPASLQLQSPTRAPLRKAVTSKDVADASAGFKFRKGACIGKGSFGKVCGNS